MTSREIREVTLWGFSHNDFTWTRKGNVMVCSTGHSVSTTEFKHGVRPGLKPLEIRGIPTELFMEFQNSKMSKEEFLESKRGYLKLKKFGI